MKKQVSVKSPFSKAALHYNYIKKEHVTAQPFERGAVFLYRGRRFGLEREDLADVPTFVIRQLKFIDKVEYY